MPDPLLSELVISYRWRYRLIHFFYRWNVRGLNAFTYRLIQWLTPHPSKAKYRYYESAQGLVFQLDPANDQGVERALYQTGYYERGLLSFLVQNLKDGDTFVDVGANIGYFTATLPVLKRGKIKVWSFEAHPTLFRRLEDHLRVNKVFDNVHAFHCALGAEKGEIELFDNFHINKGAASAFNLNEGANPSSHIVPLFTMDEWVEQMGCAPNWIKIDVEGMEWDVLKGARKTIKKYQPVLIVEYSSFEERGKEHQENLKNGLMSMDCYDFYKLSNTKDRPGKLTLLDTDSDWPKDDNIICLPRNSERL